MLILITNSGLANDPRHIEPMKKRILFATLLLLISELILLCFIASGSTTDHQIDITTNSSTFWRLILIKFNKTWLKTLRVLEHVARVFASLIPVSLFGIFHASTSCILKEMFKIVVHRLKYNRENVETHLYYYDRISEFIFVMDKMFKNLLLLTVLFVASRIYIPLFVIYKHGCLGMIDFLFLIYFVLAMAALLFFIFSTAEGVETLNGEIGYNVLKLPDNVVTCIEKLIFISKAKRCPILSLGGLVFLRKSVLLGIIGSTLTYSLLINSLPFGNTNSDVLNSQFTD